MLHPEYRKSVRIRLHDPDEVKLIFSYNEHSFEGLIWDYSRFGLGIQIQDQENIPSIVEEQIHDIFIVAFKERRAMGDGKIVQLKKDGPMVYYGIFLFREFIDLDFLAKRRKFSIQEDDLTKLKLLSRYAANIPAEFKALTADFAYQLSGFKRIFNQQDESFRNEPPEVRKNLFQAVLRGVGAEFYRFLDESMEKLRHYSKTCSRRENEQNGFYLRQIIWDYMMESPLHARTNLKPRGYAGDSAMMEMLYRNDYEGESTFGKILHKHSSNAPAAEAVRFRRGYINKEINKRIEERDAMNGSSPEQYRIASIACGPAWEIRDFLSTSPNNNRAEFVLLDQDEEALAEARSNIESVGMDPPPVVHYLQDSVRTILRTREPDLNYGQFDFIYSMGLYDYLTDPVARAVLKKLFAMLGPRGRLIIGNYHEDNPTRAHMDYVMDWTLIYRSEKALRGITEGLSGNFSRVIEYDDFKCQMFLILTREDEEPKKGKK